MTTRSHPTSSIAQTVARRAASATADSALRLAIGREGVGLELSSPVALECIRLMELSTAFRGIRFPIDVSGGVSKFRHKRGQLQRVLVEMAGSDLERWAAPRLRGIVGTALPHVWARVSPGSTTLCVSEERSADSDDRTPGSAIAFEVHALADEDIVLVVSGARGMGLSAPPTAVAIVVLRELVGSLGDCEGALVTVRRPAAALARAVLPQLGARAPAAVGVHWTAATAQGGTWILLAARDAPPAMPAERALRARQVAEMLIAADDLMVHGRLEDARNALFGVLARAPRHPEVARRIVEIDATVRGREEAALATLSEVQAGILETDPAFGILRGELLSRVGRGVEAIAAFEAAAEVESVPVLAARSFERCASLSRDEDWAARWLDRALTLWPTSTSSRWARLETRLALARIDDAMADAEHLEALTESRAGKHSVWMRAARAWQARGLSAQSSKLFERALVQLPDEPRALAGLGVALLAEGAVARGVALLARARVLAEDRGMPSSDIALDLARAFAERLDDVPTAIAHASGIAASAAEAPIARGLEGRWRAALGDVVGARLAYGRLQQWTLSAAPEAPASGSIAQLLFEAANWEATQLGDAMAAQRHALAAVRLVPTDAAARARAKEFGALVASALMRQASQDGLPGAAAAAGPQESPLSTLSAPASAGNASLEWPSLSGDEAERSLRVEELTRRLQANSSDEDAANELACLLEALDRGHELLALLSGRMEDATAEKREALAPQLEAVLARLAAAAREGGRPDEASLYDDAIASLRTREK